MTNCPLCNTKLIIKKEENILDLHSNILMGDLYCQTNGKNKSHFLYHKATKFYYINVGAYHIKVLENYNRFLIMNYEINIKKDFYFKFIWFLPEEQLLEKIKMLMVFE